MSGYPTSAFLSWLADRLENVYDESPNTDFVQRLRVEAMQAQTREEELAQLDETYYLQRSDSVFMDGRSGYHLRRVHSPGVIGTELHLTQQEADDLTIQLGLASHEKYHVPRYMDRS